MIPPVSELPDPLRFDSGAPVRTAAQWCERRAEILQRLLPIVYGELPPVPATTRAVDLQTQRFEGPAGARLLSCRVQTDGRHAFVLRLFVPVGPGPFPVLLNGDAGWRYASNAVIAAILGRGTVFAQFDRLEVAPENPTPVTAAPGPAAPGAGAPCAALAYWAWAHHRAVDVLVGFDFVDRARIGVVGHSRGGKAALLAGATDERIALTSANNSGAGGAGSFRWQGPGCETLAQIVGTFPNWFAPGLQQFAGRENELPFDQHLLKALIAPRALLSTEGLADHWANPIGTWQTHVAAREVYAFLGAQDRIAVAYRAGGHEHGMADWCNLLDFCDAVFHGKPRTAVFGVEPFPGLPAPASWCRGAMAGS